MKLLKLYIIALSALLVGGCSDSFLDSEPIVELTTGNFYKTKKDANLAIVGCYDGIQVLYASGVAFPVMSEVLSDNTYGATGKNDNYSYQLLDEFDLQRSPSDLDVLNANWEAYYKAIFRCNMLLSKMDQINWEGDTAYMHSIEAEARFLRAYAYFDMVRIWENVPLVTVPTNENVPQANPVDVYKVIAEDLAFASENGTETVEAGRINKWAAKSLLARVFLFYTGLYNQTDLAGVITKSQALTGLEDVIASGNFGLIEEYKNLWPASSSIMAPSGIGLETTYAGKDNMETIFAIKYNITSHYDDGGNTDGNHWMVMLGLRSQNFIPYGKGWGGCTVLPELYKAYEEGDTRKEASIIAINEEGLDFDNSDQREYTGYTIKKYSPLSAVFVDEDGNEAVMDVAEGNGATSFMIGQYQDYVVMRYADVLLMAAELGSANAQTYFDEVRGRAGGLESKAPTMENIMEERRLEFAFEGIRYWDLLRQGISKAAETIAIDAKVQNGGIEVDKVITQQKIEEKGGFQIIPQTQISRSGGKLKQNQGWIN